VQSHRTRVAESSVPDPMSADAAPSRRRSATRSAGVVTAVAALPALAVTAPFWIVSAFTRRLARELPLERCSLPSDETLEVIPGIGQRPRSNLDVTIRVDNRLLLTSDVVRITTDQEGWRDRETSLDEADVAVFGDGFAFGWGVADRDLFTRQTPELRTKSVGAPARSMVDTVLWLERLLSRLGGKTVVWMIYLGNDLTDNLRPNLKTRRVPFVRRRPTGWAIHTAHLTAETWSLDPEPRNYSADLAQLCTDSAEGRREFAAAIYLLERARTLCRRADADLVVMTVPKRSQLTADGCARLSHLSQDPATFDPRRPDDILGRWCREHAIAYVPLLDHLDADDYQSGDKLHWTPSGHAKVAALIAAACGPRPGPV
jgi:lysophospholipase L1-like esterase